MSKIESIEPSIRPRPAEPPGPTGAGDRPADVNGTSDVDEVFAASILAGKVDEMPAVRADLVERVKAEIAAGEYETDERLEATVNKLLEDLLPES